MFWGGGGGRGRHSFTHAIYFAIWGLLAKPSDFLQQCEACQKCMMLARISNGWLVCPSRNNVRGGHIWLLSPGDVWFNFLFSTQRRRMHQSEGWQSRRSWCSAVCVTFTAECDEVDKSVIEICTLIKKYLWLLRDSHKFSPPDFTYILAFYTINKVNVWT